MSSDDKLPRDRWPPCVEVIDDRMAEVYRKMTPEERWRRIGEMFDSMREYVKDAIRSQRPGLTEAEVDAEWRRRLRG